jgi:N-acetylmuramoyl-L-alanine amidase
MAKIAFDAGHGLKTSGKQTPDGIKEWTLNDKVRDKAVAMLKEYDVEILNVDNDEGNVDESLSSRLNKYLKAGVDSFVAFHHNAFTGKWNKATGVEVWIDKNATDEDQKLAKLVYDRLVEYTGLKGRGIKRKDFTVINQNSVPAILCEGGFMDGTEDYKVITSEEGQNAYARAVVEGLIEFHGLKKKPKPVTQDAPKKTIEELAKEVLAGKWGNGAARTKALTDAGYDAKAVQAKVNDLLDKNKPADTVDKKDESFKVKVSITNLNIRTGPGTNYSRTGRFTGKGVFTITETKKGQGSTKGWGRLKSGTGWISLDHATKI